MYKRVLDSFRCADVMHLDAVLRKPGNEGEVRRNMSGAAAACQYNLFTHSYTCLWNNNLTHHSIMERRGQEHGCGFSDQNNIPDDFF